MRGTSGQRRANEVFRFIKMEKNCFEHNKRMMWSKYPHLPSVQRQVEIEFTIERRFRMVSKVAVDGVFIALFESIINNRSKLKLNAHDAPVVESTTNNGLLQTIKIDFIVYP